MDWNLFFTITGTGITTVGLIYAFLWNFKNDMISRLEKLDEKLSSRIDKLSDKVEDVDRRLCRIEGRLATQGHCIFNKTREEKKAE